jgi:hypothetical protein
MEIKMTEKLEIEKVADIRRLLASWLQYACDNKHMPFEKDSGYIIQVVNAILRSLEMEIKEMENTKLEEIEKRLAALESGERTFVVPTPVVNGKHKQKEEPCKE